MRKITLDANGEIITLDQINKEIYDNLAETLKNQLQKKEANMYLKKPFQLKFGAVINNKLLQLFRQYGLMSDEDYQTLEADDLKDYFLHFMDLVNKISLDIEITPTKPMFCAYMGITTKMFNKLEKTKDDGLRKWVDAINGDLTNSIFDSSLQGNGSEKTSLAFASTKDYGQETVQNDFTATLITKKEVDFTPQQALAQANNVVALIEEMKKASKQKEKDKRG